MKFRELLESENVTPANILKLLKSKGFKGKKLKTYTIKISTNGSFYDGAERKWTVYQLDNGWYVVGSEYKTKYSRVLKSIAADKDLEKLQDYFGVTDYDTTDDKPLPSSLDFYFSISPSKLKLDDLVNVIK